MTFSSYEDSTMRIFNLYIIRNSKSAKNYPKSLPPAIIIVNMLSIQLNRLPVHTHTHIMHTHGYTHTHTTHTCMHTQTQLNMDGIILHSNFQQWPYTLDNTLVEIPFHADV